MKEMRMTVPPTLLIKASVRIQRAGKASGKDVDVPYARPVSGGHLDRAARVIGTGERIGKKRENL